MNDYLLVLVHEMDDCPIRLFATRAKCVAYAESRDVAAGLTTPEREVLQTDASTQLGLVMITFFDGFPVKREVLKWIEN